MKLKPNAVEYYKKTLREYARLRTKAESQVVSDEEMQEIQDFENRYILRVEAFLN